MNFLLRSTFHVGAESHSSERPAKSQYPPKSTQTLGSLIAEDPLPYDSNLDYYYEEITEFEGKDGGVGIIENHLDVSEQEGWLMIPYKELPDNWDDTPDIQSLRSLDRSFVFTGEQLHILACLSVCKQATEIITPFQVAAAMNRNGIKKSPCKQNESMENGLNSVSIEGEASNNGHVLDQNYAKIANEKIDQQKDVTESETLLRMEDYNRRSESLLKTFKNSNFYVRIAESGDELWSRKTAPEISPDNPVTDGQKSTANEIRTATGRSSLSAIVDKGKFDVKCFGGAARNTVKCCSLSNGDIVVLLQVNVGVDYLKDPVIEILQFENHQDRNCSSQIPEKSNDANQDPCGGLLKWLLPLDNTLHSSTHSLNSHRSSSGPESGSASHRPSKSVSSTSQFFSLGHFRSNSMPSILENAALDLVSVKPQTSMPSLGSEKWDPDSSYELLKGKTGAPDLLSFRGVRLEREKVTSSYGMEGIYIPGRRWRRKIEIIQPVEIHSFVADCNTDDLLCVQIKNVSPQHRPDIVIYVDTIAVTFEEAVKYGPPSSIPIACIEAGIDHSLPNLALRRGEEHSFILKPVSFKGFGESNPLASNPYAVPETVEIKGSALDTDRYAIIVSCRCNYTESRLFFKQPIKWKPHKSRDLKISVVSEMSRQSSWCLGRVNQLPLQVVTLQVSNLTSEDLTLTILAPASFASPLSVVSLSSPPSSLMSPLVGLPEFTKKLSSKKRVNGMHRLGSVPVVSEFQEGKGSVVVTPPPVSDAILSSGLECTHLWQQSRVPLGCLPSRSTTTIKLKLLLLTDGIITLDTLQVDVKEKGVIYIPDHPLKICATSSTSSGII